MSDSASQPCPRVAKSSKVSSLSKAINHSDIHFQLKENPPLEVLSLRNLIIFKLPGVFLSNLREFKPISIHSHSAGAFHKFQLGSDFYNAKFD